MLGLGLSLSLPSAGLSGSSSSDNKMILRMTLGTNASYSSNTSLPANSVVTRCALDVTTQYSAGTTIVIGQTGSSSLLMSATGAGTDGEPAVGPNLYDAPQDTAWGSTALPVLVTISGSPSVGAAFVLVEYSNGAPNS